MKKISLLEKIAVNLPTPFEYMVKPSLRNKFSAKTRSYRVLLTALEDIQDYSIIDPYKKSLCGRLQIFLAIKRGAISQEVYDSFK